MDKKNSETIFDGKKIGYARVSTNHQDLSIQLDKLKEVGCTKIYSEKLSGKNSKRPQLQACLDYLREGDILYVTKLDRLARSLKDLTKILEQFKDENIALITIDQNFETSTPTGKLTYAVLAAISEFENDIRHERMMEGIKNAKEKGIKFGRRPKIDSKMINSIIHDLENMDFNQMSKRDIAKKHNIGIATLYRILKSPEYLSALENRKKELSHD